MMEEEKIPRNLMKRCRLALSISIRQLNDEDPDVRSEALYTIAELALDHRRRLYDAKCLPRIVEMMDDQNGRVRLNACHALVRLSGCVNDMGCDTVQLQKAIGLLEDESPHTRIVAAGLIDRLAMRGRTDNYCLPGLAKMIDGGDEEAKLRAFIALCRLAEHRIYDLPILEDAMGMLRNAQSAFEIIRAAGLIGDLAKNGVYDAKCLPLLVPRLDAVGHFSVEVRTSICQALNELAIQGIFDSHCLEKIIEQFEIGDMFLSTASADLIGNLAKNGLYDSKCISWLMILPHVGDDILAKDAIMLLGRLDPLLTHEERRMLIEVLGYLNAEIRDFDPEKPTLDLDQMLRSLTREERRRFTDSIVKSVPIFDRRVKAAARSVIERLLTSEERIA